MTDEYTGPGCYEFTFRIVMEGESMADALEQTYDYLTNQPSKPSKIELLSIMEDKA